MSKKDNFFKRAIFLGPKGVSVGQASVNHENVFSFKKIGDFGKLLPVMRFRDINEYYFVDMDEYNPKDGDYTGNTWRIYFCDLVDGKKFSFNDSTPTQNMLMLRTLQTENNELRNSFQKVLKIIDLMRVDDYMKKQVQDIVEQSRKLTSYSPTSPLQTNNK